MPEKPKAGLFRLNESLYVHLSYMLVVLAVLKRFFFLFALCSLEIVGKAAIL